MSLTTIGSKFVYNGDVVLPYSTKISKMSHPSTSLFMLYDSTKRQPQTTEQEQVKHCNEKSLVMLELWGYCVGRRIVSPN
jgi:hypothetical protein